MNQSFIPHLKVLVCGINVAVIVVLGFRGGGTGGAGGAIAPPTFGSSILIQSYSTTNILGRLNIC